MKVLSNAECVEWLTARNYEFSINDTFPSRAGWVDMPELEYVRVYFTPIESRDRMVLASKLARWVVGSDVLLWFSAWPFHSNEEETIFREFRAFGGEQRFLEDAPGYLLSFEDAADTHLYQSLLYFMIAFDWEAYIMRGDQQSILRMEDCVIWTVTQDWERDRHAAEIFDSLGILERDLESLPDIPEFGGFWFRTPRPGSDGAIE